MNNESTVTTVTSGEGIIINKRYVVVSRLWINAMSLAVGLMVVSIAVMIYYLQAESMRATRSEVERRAYGKLSIKRTRAGEQMFKDIQELRLKLGMSPARMPDIYSDEPIISTDDSGHPVMLDELTNTNREN